MTEDLHHQQGLEHQQKLLDILNEILFREKISVKNMILLASALGLKNEFMTQIYDPMTISSYRHRIKQYKEGRDDL